MCAEVIYRQVVSGIILPNLCFPFTHLLNLEITKVLQMNQAIGVEWITTSITSDL